jgi:hypothetical protein
MHGSELKVTTQGWATTDERLWNGVIGAFNRQYADVLEQEKAQAELGRGICMQNGDLDGLITRFEQLVRHANYDVNQPLVLHIFTDALPHAMYEYIFKNIQPRCYDLAGSNRCTTCAGDNLWCKGSRLVIHSGFDEAARPN